MKEKCIIKVTGVQKDTEGTENKIELITEGICYRKKNNLYIVYKETEISGMEGATTTLKIDGRDKVSMRRFGNAAMQIVFQQGKSYDSRYRTQFGDFDMKVFTRELAVDLCKQQKGEIAIKYDLWVMGMLDTDNQINIELM